MKPVRNLLWLVLFITLLTACRKEQFTSSQSSLLHTTVDTLHYDTLFTSTGSITQVVKIINPNDKGIHIGSVKLAGGNTSFFKINVDGTPGPQVTGVDVLADDSVYIFATVSIDPSAPDLPFIVRDSIEIVYNGNTKWVQLEAYGQNAHFFRNRIVTGSETWNNDRPYVILGQLTIDTTALLTINKGCRIHIHADAPVIVNGSLQVAGEKAERVVFTGDRLDLPYRDFPASYPGILFSSSSTNNSLRYAVIKNAYQGIVVTDPSPGIKLRLHETIIDNAYDAGITAINSSIIAENLLVSNCGKSILLLQGGNYDFNHTTVACISNSYVPHREPALVVTNFLNMNNVPVAADLNARFRNSIFWGEANGLVDDEVIVARSGSTVFQVDFDQVLWRVTNTPQHSSITGAINNTNPLFDSINTSERIYSFRLKPQSPAVDKGIPTTLNIDLDGAPRPVGLPDLGSYEQQ